MARSTPIRFVLPACLLMLIACCTPCAAHMLWVKTISHDGGQHAFLFFGESAVDEAYHLPDALADATLWRRTAENQRSELRTAQLDTDERIGLIAPLKDGEPCVLEANEQYGVYGTALLAYSAKHVHANSSKQFNAAGASKELKLDVVPRVAGDRLELTVLWNGRPLAGADVSLRVDDEQEGVEKTTDEKGRVTFEPEGEGIVSVLTSRMDESLTGELNGKPYDHGLQYASLTFNWPIGRQAASGKGTSRAAVPPLPEPLSSFGAAVVDGWLYVYGGHIGTEHDHSAANLSNHFRRIRIEAGSEWEELPMQTPLQGLAVVAHDGKLYRIGGMNARNETVEEEEDLHSTDEFAAFDPASGKWSALAPLPRPRSSHNAVVIGDRLYVVGGWTLGGEADRTWQTDALVFDFDDPAAGWQTLAEQPFARRALAASHWKGKLVALGGLDEEGEVSQRVDMFDPQSGEWSEGPKLPGDGRGGFGISAWNLDGRLYFSGLPGILYRLSEDGSEWEEAARLAKPRFFHQLVPAGDGGLLAVGGASSEGHIADIEWIDVGK